MALGQVWLQFLICAGAIAVCGNQLSRYGDVLAEKTALGRTWLGLVLLAAVTSLPELVTGTSAIVLYETPNIAVGNVLGACVFNFCLLAIADFMHPVGPVLTAADRGHLVAGAFVIIMAAVVSLGMLPRPPINNFALLHMGVSAPVLIMCYLVAMRTLFRYQRRELTAYLSSEVVELTYPGITLNQAMARFTLNAAVVMAAALWLPGVAVNLAHLMGWSQSLVGTIFVALATTLPECAVTIGAMRLGAVDLAVGNILGSNLFNLGLLGFFDALYWKGPLLQLVVPGHEATALLVIIMGGIAGIEQAFRPAKKALRRLSWGMFVIVLLYGANILLLMLTQIPS